MNYKNYLSSPDWANKRMTKLNRKGGAKRRCAICGGTNKLNVHHLIYSLCLKDIKQEDLRILCERCHLLTHKLFKEGLLKFKGTNHNSRFATTKNIVKRELGLTKENLFSPSAWGSVKVSLGAV